MTPEPRARRWSATRRFAIVALVGLVASAAIIGALWWRSEARVRYVTDLANDVADTAGVTGDLQLFGATGSDIRCPDGSEGRSTSRTANVIDHDPGQPPERTARELEAAGWSVRRAVGTGNQEGRSVLRAVRTRDQITLRYGVDDSMQVTATTQTCSTPTNELDRGFDGYVEVEVVP